MTTPTSPPPLPCSLTAEPTPLPDTTATPANTDLTLLIGQSTTHHPMQQPVYCQDITIALPTGDSPDDLHTTDAALSITTGVPYPSPHLPGHNWSITTTRASSETRFTCIPDSTPAIFDGTHPITITLGNVTPNHHPGTATITITQTTALTPTGPYNTNQHHININKQSLHSTQI
ncbi:hypothetical protein ACIQU6_43235 [Streptomyces sp. NPDC090442]|uniref:hypothetical protein n=1 Tax=Streptomyces sp. NPDC090442 TaxID=3365962 RepID=UPI00382C0F26